MKLASLVSYLLVAADVARSNFYREPYVDKAIEGILQSIGRRDVIVRIRRHDIQDGAQRLLDIVARNVAVTWPSQILVSREMRFNFQLRSLASSRTLLIYIFASNDDISDAELNATLNDIDLISHPKHMPELLLMIGSNRGALNCRRQLKYLWDRKVFDVIILEVYFHPRYSEPTFVAVHRFNGFNDDYSKITAYKSEIEWYPNKLRNMYGGIFKVMFEEVRPYGTLENGTVGGLAKLFMDALSNAVNGTVVHAKDLRETEMSYNAEGLVYEDWYGTQHEHTVSVGDDRVCALVPAMPAARVLVDFWQIILTILFGFLLSGVVWCVSLAMKVRKRVRDPLNTIGMFFGMPPLRGPRTLMEKVLFVAVTITVAEYTIMFQAELLEFVVEFTVSTRVSSFQDLYNTGLKVVVSPVVYDELTTTEGLSPDFIKRFLNSPEYELQNKGGWVDTSKAYFTSEITGKLAETRLKRRGRRLFKLSNLCILSHYRVHRLHVRSPYKSEIDKVLLSLTESGFVDKYVEDFWRNDKSERKSEKEMILSDYSVYVAFFVIIVGHVISSIVFLGEIIAGRLLKSKHLTLFCNCCKLKIPKHS
ncbi:hypothetical protein PUN28_012283 [Cardiocondyla obscurior]|uniref:Uncharacterized protein n=1 Tax=Cardiocondyla obscurior TaxID=286306 RepID=A0AAW2FBP0_9HYME